MAATGDAESCEYLSRTSSETLILKHSQSPTYIEEQSEEKIEIPAKVVPILKKRCRETLNIKQNVPKLLQISPIALSPVSPVAKRQKEGENGRLATSDYWCDITEDTLRMEKILCSQIDIQETYQTLLRFTTVIPCPRPLLVPDVTDNRCRWEDSQLIEDRKKAIFSLFSRRTSLRLCSATLHLAVGILDQCLEKLLVDKFVVSDLAAVSLMLASKVEEVNYLHVSNIMDSGLIENKTFAMVCSLERLVLSTLSFQVTFPTPHSFATYLLVHLHASPTAIHLTHYLLELSLLYVHNRLAPSDIVAHSATCLSLAILCETNKSSTRSLLDAESRLNDFYDSQMASDRDMMRIMADLFLVALEEKHSVYREYATHRRHAVALRLVDSQLQKTLMME